MKTKTAFNPFDYLDTQEEIKEYLTDGFIYHDPTFFLTALCYLAQKRA